MRYYVKDDTGSIINTIEATQHFAESYAKQTGYTLESFAPDPVEPVEAEPTELDQLRADIDYLAIMTGVEL